MDAHLSDLLAQLRRVGLIIRLDGGDLLVQENGADTPEQRDFVRAHKAEIVALLQEQPQALAPVNVRTMSGGAMVGPRTAEREMFGKWLRSG